MKIRTMHVEELDFASMFIGQAKVSAIKEAVAKGGKLEMKESGFSDAGGDFTQILVDGIPQATMDGY
jgi:hypothetical protein